ncbi:amidase [Glacieibacterium frigidum]|uniref:Amidase n=1 Tax=Glacieibacterium frigidum TaxID=2593303 RepID=A0A552UII6_9SPHN|nr:amidase [Glacieibacterium frigidum]TRW18038.1 amidase [Glacieibacterium frigidum]
MSAVARVEAALVRIARSDLRAFVDLDREAALAAARASDARSAPLPLDGVTFGIKSNIAVAGLPWTAGMALHRERIAAKDAAVVTRLREAGAIILGTVNMHEAALGATTDNAFFGRTLNPHDTGRTPGGSSGGSGAAVAAGLCDAALGTDTLGSVRIPAAYNGVYGLKPTHGAVDDDGLEPLARDLDAVGPLARSLDLLERVWGVIGTPSAGHAKRLVLLDELAGVEVESAVRTAYDRAVAALDLPRSSLTLRDTPQTIRLAGFIAAGRELAADLGDHDPALISPELRYMLSFCTGAAPTPDVLARTRETLLDALGDDGVLLTPTAPQAAFAHGRGPVNQADFTGLANIAGCPALSLPAGRDGDGMPVGVQLVGPPGSEGTLFALARTLDAALDGYAPPPEAP